MTPERNRWVHPGHRRRFLSDGHDAPLLRLAATPSRVRDAGLQESKTEEAVDIVQAVSDGVRAFPDYISDATGSLHFT